MSITPHSTKIQITPIMYCCTEKSCMGFLFSWTHPRIVETSSQSDMTEWYLRTGKKQVMRTLSKTRD